MLSKTPEKNIFKDLPEIHQEIPKELDEYFDALRQCGDDDADKLVENTLLASDEKSGQTGRQGYNQLLDIADIIADNPELALSPDTVVTTKLKDYPDELKYCFTPGLAPEWVNEDKLKKSGELWRKDMLAIISVLYAKSLPACYLMKNGIPALYRTAKLVSPRYIYQRIYETGLMLDAVLSPGGLHIVRDIPQSPENYYVELLKNLNSAINKEENQQAKNNKAANDPTPDWQQVKKDIETSMQNEEEGTRYLWGKGYITAKKIRFLHASIRFKLMNPDKCSTQNKQASLGCFANSANQLTKAYDAVTLGVPVNQEDLVYTLLTFAYCIPKGLEKWGRKWNAEEREAFLHTWNVIGYTMGIHENLLPHTWDDAERLFHLIQKRQAAESEKAKELTCALINFFQGYLPRHFGLNKGIAARLIRKQLGEEHAALIMPEESIKASGKFFTVIVFAISMIILKIFYRVRRTLYKIPFVCNFFKSLLCETGVDLVNSWRDIYDRKPFYISREKDTWQKIDGISLSYIKILRDWRHKLFNTIALGLGSLIGAGLSLASYITFWILDKHDYWVISGWTTLALAMFGIFVLRYWVRSVSCARPKPEKYPIVDPEFEEKLKEEQNKENQVCAVKSA